VRTKYIGFVKTSFSSPSLPFRIEGIRPRKNRQIPSFFSSAAHFNSSLSPHPKKEQSCIPKKPTCAQKETFLLVTSGARSLPYPGFTVSQRRRTRLCEKSDRKQGEKRSTSPIFSLFLSVFFRKQRHPSTGFSKRRHQELSETEQIPLQKTASDRSLYAKTRDGRTCRRRLCTQPTAELACTSPTLSRFLRTQKNSYPSSDG